MSFWFQVVAPVLDKAPPVPAPRPIVSTPTRINSNKPLPSSPFGLRDDIRDAELLLAAFRTLLLVVLAVSPFVLRVDEAFTIPAMSLMVLAGIYNIAMGVACLFPARFGVRRPIVLAMDTTLITAWVHLSGRFELVTLYFVVVVVAAMWFRVFGGVVAAAICNFLFLFLWGRIAAEAPLVGRLEPFPFGMAVNSALLFVIGALAGYISEAQERERNARLERELLIANYQHELDISGEMQPLLMGRPDFSTPFDFGLAFRSARATGGGDYLDVLPLPDGRVLCCIADVSGKSVRAQARVPLLKYSLRALAPLYPDPVDLMAHLQTTLAPDLGPDLYIAICLAAFDAPTKTISWCNAGHIPPLLVPANGDVIELEATCAPLGLWPEIEPQSKKTAFHPGDALLMATDGLSDALSFGGEVDGEAQVRLLTPRLVGENAISAPEAAQKMVELAEAALENNSFIARNFTMGEELGEPHAYMDDVAVLVAYFPAEIKA
ncbi:serine/threonine-protein phosphatase [bacterium]|nr:MAG: serine/threonine-protein phosphatase [bacterium]